MHKVACNKKYDRALTSTRKFRQCISFTKNHENMFIVIKNILEKYLKELDQERNDFLSIVEKKNESVCLATTVLESYHKTFSIGNCALKWLCYSELL